MIKLICLFSILIMQGSINCDLEDISQNSNLIDKRSLSMLIRNQKYQQQPTRANSIVTDPIDRYLILYIMYARALQDKVLMSPSQIVALEEKLNVLEKILKKYVMTNKTYRNKILDLVSSVKSENY